jgi:multidrug efflux system membrane fusion protein
VAADKAALDLARLQLSYTTLRAPFAGVVGAKLAHPGATVKINETELVSLNRIRPLYVSFAVPEKHLPASAPPWRTRRASRSASPCRDTTTRHSAAPSASSTTAVDAATGTIRMKAELANPAETLTPGQYMSVGLVLDTLRGAVVVPTEAVQQGPEGAFVYVVGADAGTQVRRVEVSAQRDGWSAVARGLAEGETVVTDGHSRLVPGARVKARGAEPGKDGKAPPAPGH